MDLLVVSDACTSAGPEPYHSWRAASRLICGILLDQVRSLRFRALLERFVNHGDAVCYLQIGISCAEVLHAPGKEDQLERLGVGRLAVSEARRAASMRTDIRRLAPADLARLFRHGFEVADYSLSASLPAHFECLGSSRLPTLSTAAVQHPAAPWPTRQMASLGSRVAGS